MDNKYLIINYNILNYDIIHSVVPEFECGDFVDCKYDEYYSSGNYVLFCDDEGELLSNLNMWAEEEKYAKLTVIINDTDPQQNELYAKDVKDFIKKYGITKDFQCYVYGDDGTAFYPLERESLGLIRFVDITKVPVFDFVAKYPLTLALDKRHIDFDTATVKPDVQINVAMLGFGACNRGLFNALVSTNQFTALREGRLEPKPVNYFLYTENADELDDEVFDYFRYLRHYAWLKVKGNDYLPLPHIPANEKLYLYDKNSIVNQLKAVMSDRDSANVVIIDFEDDKKNVQIANMLADSLDSNIKIFVKVGETLSGNDIRPHVRCTVYGNNTSIVYNLGLAEGGAFGDMAYDRHMAYISEYMPEANLDTVSELAKRKWFEMSPSKRQSNLYSCLSIRPKLNLLGYDITNDEAAVDVSEEFLAKYQAGDEILYCDDPTGRRRVVSYGDCEFKENTVRNNFAKQEHLRWNAYEICCGMLPATVEEIKTKSKEQLFEEHKHGNLTTYGGLLKYKKIAAALKGISESEADVIKYDYQIMDYVVWLVRRNGYKIVLR